MISARLWDNKPSCGSYKTAKLPSELAALVIQEFKLLRIYETTISKNQKQQLNNVRILTAHISE